MTNQFISSILRTILISLNIAVPSITFYLVFSTQNLEGLTLYNQLDVLSNLGKLAGTASILVFCVTILPGILRRFKVSGFLKNLQLILIPIRAHLGVYMFFLALTHYIFVKIVPTISLQLPLDFKFFEILGLISFLLSIPLALTSTLMAKKYLKQKWQKLHNLTYAILWFIFAHVAFLSAIPIASLIFLTGILQLTSLFYSLKKS